MKALLLLLSGVVICLELQAQGLQEISGSNNTSGLIRYEVGTKGPSHRVWNKITAITNKSGYLTLATNAAYVELAAGMHYIDNGQWKETKEEFTLSPGWALARKGPHKVGLAYNLNVAGAVAVELPDGRVLRSSVLSLHYVDKATGQTVRLAEVKDCAGSVLPPNQVLYADAFSNLLADVRYTYTKAGIEQDVILRQQPPSPESYGLNSATTRLVVLTEFINPPPPVIQEAPASGAEDSTDQALGFGSMRIGWGRAFAQATNQTDVVRRRHTPVMKKWMTVNGRHFLMEQVRVQDVRSELDKLPLQASIGRKQNGKDVAHVQVGSSVKHARDLDVPEPLLHCYSERNLEVAHVTHERPGYVLDYVQLNNSLTNFTFQSNTTYYISGPVTLEGTNYVEAGSVIKYKNYDWAEWTSGANLNFGSSAKLIFATDSTHPAVFTAKDDDSIGETINGSTGAPNLYYGYSALCFPWLGKDLDVHDVRISYSLYGLEVDAGPASHSVRDSQFTHNSTALYSDKPATYENLLIYDSWRAMACFGSTINASHLTVDRATKMFEAGTFNVTNSLFVEAGNLVSTNYPTALNGLNNATNETGVEIFQTVGAGTHYMADNSPYRDVGTADIDPVLLARLQTRTTYPPPGSYADTNAPDLGFHYPQTTDWDGDGMEDGWELNHFTNLLQNATGDFDGDGLSNLREFQLGTNPANADQDSDALPDGWEYSYFGNLAQTGGDDFDGDGLTNAEEYQHGWNPANPDQDSNGMLDGQDDWDGDLLSNEAELHKYLTDPLDAYSSAEQIVKDAVYRLSSKEVQPNETSPTLMRLENSGTVVNGNYTLTLSGATPGKMYEFLVRYVPASGPWTHYQAWFRTNAPASGIITRTIPAIPPPGYIGQLDVSGLGEDSDGDGLSDVYEVEVTHTLPDIADTNHNGINDGAEDLDGDGIPNVEEYTGKTDPNSSDVMIPLIIPPGGTYTEAQHVSVYSPTADTAIRYTLNGSEPTTSSPTISSGSELPSTIDTATTLKVKAWKNGVTTSRTVTAVYSFGIAPPVISSAQLAYNGAGEIVYMSGSTPGSQIRYTLDGSDPTLASTLYVPGDGVAIAGTSVLKAAAWVGAQRSAIVTRRYVVRSAPANDMFANRQALTGASGTVWGSAIGAGSEILEGYAAPYPSTVWFEWTAPFSGDFTFQTRGDTELFGATYYSDGDLAACMSGSTYIAGSSGTVPATFTAVGGQKYLIRLLSYYALNYSVNWRVGAQTATPIFNNPGGTFKAGQMVAITSDTLEATIRYTLDGTTPDEQSLELKRGMLIHVTSSETIKAKAWRQGLLPSDTTTATFTIDLTAASPTTTVGKPTATPSKSEFPASMTVVLQSPTGGAKIYYTLDGTTPAITSAFVENGGTLTFSASTALRFKAFKAGSNPSEMVVALYAKQNVDTDFDGMPDTWEIAHGSDMFVPDEYSISTEPWAHGLQNWQVCANPSVLNSDFYSSAGDGIADWWKIMYGYDIHNPSVGTYIGQNGATLSESYADGLNPTDPGDAPNLLFPVRCSVIHGIQNHLYIALAPNPPPMTRYILTVNGASASVLPPAKGADPIIEIPSSLLGSLQSSPESSISVIGVDAQSRRTKASSYDIRLPLDMNASRTADFISKNEALLRLQMRAADPYSPFIKEDQFDDLKTRGWFGVAAGDSWYHSGISTYVPRAFTRKDAYGCVSLYIFDLVGGDLNTQYVPVGEFGAAISLIHPQPVGNTGYLSPWCEAAARTSQNISFPDYWPLTVRHKGWPLDEAFFGGEDVFDGTTVKTGRRNTYGLAYRALKFKASATGVADLTALAGGAPVNLNSLGLTMLVFQDVETPSFKTVSHYFGTCFSSEYEPPYPDVSELPAVEEMSPDNYDSLCVESPTFMMPVGTKCFTAWSRLAVYRPAATTPVPDRFGYVLQLFDKAYLCDAGTGDVPRTAEDNVGGKKKINKSLAKSAGVLSPFGEFTAFKPGKYILTTIADADGLYGELVVNVLDMAFMNVDENNAVTLAPDVEMSHPAPVLSIDVGIDDVEASNDGKSIHGLLNIEGQIKSAVADITPGSDGTITEVLVYLNDSDEPVATIPVTVTKTEAPNSFLRPFPFTGSIASSFDIPLVQGVNIVKLVARDPFNGNDGFAQYHFEVEALSPDAQSGGPAASLSVYFPASLSPTLNNSCRATIVGSSRVDLQACKLEYSIVSPK